MTVEPGFAKKAEEARDANGVNKIVEKPKRKHRSYFDKLSVNERYLVMSALRGPDHAVWGNWGRTYRGCQVEKIGNIKGIVTTRLRGIVFPHSKSYQNGNPRSIDGDLSYRTVGDYDITLLRDTCNHISSHYPERNVRHYINHTIRALAVTQNHPVWNGKAKEMVTILASLDEPGRSY